MNRLESLLLRYSAGLWTKLAAYALALGLAVTLFFRFDCGLDVLLLLGVPLGLDLWGTFVIWRKLPAFREDVLENLETGCLAACGVAPGDPHDVSFELDGAIDHWLLGRFPAEAVCTVMAPGRDEVVIASRRGRIFPPERVFGKVTYHDEDAGSRDIFYADIAAVDLNGKTLTMTTSGGEAITYLGRGENAAGALSALRARLREFKSRGDAPAR